jgi:hypothetical protein
MSNLEYYRTSAPIKLASAPLTNHYTEFAKQTEAGKASDARYRRLMSILRPEIGPSVVHYDYTTTHATIDVSGPKVRDNRTIGGNPDAEAQRLEDIERIANGQPLVERLDTQGQMDHEARTRGAIEVVLESTAKKITEERARLGAEYNKKIQPAFDERVKRFKKSLADFYAAHREISGVYQDHRDSGIAFPANGPLPDFMREADSFFQSAVHHEYVTTA